MRRLCVDTVALPTLQADAARIAAYSVIEKHLLTAFPPVGWHRSAGDTQCTQQVGQRADRPGHGWQAWQAWLGGEAALEAAGLREAQSRCPCPSPSRTDSNTSPTTGCDRATGAGPRASELLPGVVEVRGVLGVPGTSMSSPSTSSDQDTVRCGGITSFLGTGAAWWSPLAPLAAVVAVPFMFTLLATGRGVCLRRALSSAGQAYLSSARPVRAVRCERAPDAD